jgi:hypothetical protein
MDIFRLEASPLYRNRTIVKALEDINPVEIEDTDKKDGLSMPQLEAREM